MEINRTLIPTDLKYIKKYRDSIVESLEKKQVDQQTIFKFKLVLDELITNSYKHGNQYDSKKNIEAVIVWDNDYTMIKIKDEGDGIKTVYKQDLLSNHGRGIKIVTSLVDEVIIKDNTIAVIILDDDKKIAKA